MANEIETTDLVVTEDFIGTMERPKSLTKDLTGTEDIGADEIRLPRIGIAQGLSPQMTPGESQYIDNLKLIDMFNDLTGEVYGRGPIKFIPLRRDIRRIEFKPRSEGGGIVDLNVPAGDPRLEWTHDEVSGKGIPPVATKFDEYVIFLLRPGKLPEPIVLSIKHTNKWNRRAVENFNTFIKLRNAPIYAGLYTLESKSEKNDNGTFGVPVIKNAGFIPVDTTQGKALFDYCEKFAKSLEGKEIVTEREPGDEDINFN